MLKYDPINKKFGFLTQVVRFISKDEPMVKYTDDRFFWIEFVNRDPEHQNLSFEPLVPTDEQKARLEELNGLIAPDEYDPKNWIGDASLYVEYGAVEKNTGCPYLKDKVGSAKVKKAQLKQLADRKLAQLAHARWKIETGGIEVEVDGKTMNVPTNRESQMAVNNTYFTLKEGFEKDTPWKSPEGWVIVDLEKFKPVAKAVASHVRKAFSAEKEVQEMITGESDPEKLKDIDPRFTLKVKFEERG